MDLSSDMRTEFQFVQPVPAIIAQGHPLPPALTVREYLPERRPCITQKVKIGRQSVFYSFGLYPDGRPGELFVDVAKAGAALRKWAGESAMMLSVALQHRTPLVTIISLYIGTESEPCGEVKGHPFITRCLSIMDLIARDMAVTFLGLNQYKDV